MKDLKLPAYGGQAVIEGVMMRGKQSVAIAMRAPEGNIILHQEPLGAIYKSRIISIPFLRGLIMLWDALGLGMRSLTISANIQTGEDEKIEGPIYFLTIFISLSFAIGLFFLIPAITGQFIEKQLNWNAWWGNLVEGLVRLIFLLAYIAAIGRIGEIRRVFAYHGAEHKTINAFEAGAELTPENVARFSLEHPRCGTAFLLTVVIISVLLFGLLGPLPWSWRILSRIILLPVLAGISYEYIRWTSNHMDSPLVSFIVKPNLALQHMTTRQPSLDMLEVSIAAFNTMRSGEQEIIA